MEKTAKRWGVEIALKAGEFLAGGLAGYLFSQMYPQAPDGLEWTIGAIVFIAAQMMEVTFRAGLQAERQDGVLSALSQTLATEGTERALLQAGLGYAGRELTPTETNIAWQKLSLLTQKSYVATNYIDPEEFYKSGLAEDVVQLQKAKIRVQEDFTVKKVLIWKNAQERDSALAEDIRRLHLDDPRASMDLKGILYEKIAKNEALCDDLARHLDGHIDFAIFDKRVVLTWQLTDDRKISGGCVIVGKDPAGRFCEFFDILSREASPITTHTRQLTDASTLADHAAVL